MSLHPIKRKDFVRKLKRLGFSDIQPGAKHVFMRIGSYRQRLPNDEEYSVPLLKRVLKQVEQGIGRTLRDDEWNDL